MFYSNIIIGQRSHLPQSSHKIQSKHTLIHIHTRLDIRRRYAPRGISAQTARLYVCRQRLFARLAIMETAVLCRLCPICKDYVIKSLIFKLFLAVAVHYHSLWTIFSLRFINDKIGKLSI